MIFYIYYVLLTFMHGAEGEHPFLDLNTPSIITDLRLVNGMGLFDGILELQINGTWADVCYGPHYTHSLDVASFINTRVVCHYWFNLPYKRSEYEYNSNVHTIKLYCNGSETNITECIFGPEVCFPHMRLYIACSDQYFPWNITDIRLVNGTGPYDGRVELKYKDQWGTICNKWMNTEVGDTLCRMLNLSFTARYSTAKFGQGTGPVLFGMVVCRYNPYNPHINNCYSMEQPSKWFCDHSEDSSIICTDCGLPNITNGWITSSNGSIMTVTCNTGYLPTTYNIECLNNGTWSKNETCKLYDCGLPNITNGRITSSNGSIMTVTCNTGYVPSTYNIECLNNGTWSKNETCKLYDCGLPNISNGWITSSNGNIMTVTCNTGYVPTTYNIECLNNGTWSKNETCKLYGYPLNITDVTLADGLGKYDGRLEVKVNDTWGTVCATSFYSSEAKAICNMFNSTLRRYDTVSNTRYSSGSGPIYIDKLDCNGSETHLNQCKYNVLNTCTHSSDVAVICNGAPLNISSIRLTNGTGPYNGRVELLVDGTWGTICNDYWFGLNEAKTLCNMMNISLLTYYTTPVYGVGSGPIYISELSCNGIYNDINLCSYRTPSKFYPGYCTKSNDVSLECTDCEFPNITNGWITSSNGSIMTVTCNTGYVPTTYNIECLNNGTWSKNETCKLYGYPLNITDVRLADGFGKYDGRLEVKVNDTWGTVCATSFYYSEARTICNMLNSEYIYSYIDYTDSKMWYSSGSGPIWIDRLDCNGSETHLNQCKYNVLNTCNHSSDVAVICNGAPLNISSIQLTNGTGPYNGRVELLVDGTWGTICNDDWFGLDEAKTLCNMMNLSLLSVYTTPVYEVDPAPRHIIRLSCHGIYNDINECFYITPYLDCGINGVSLACTGGCGLPNITNGRITSSNGRVMVVTCNTGYIPTTYNIECLNNSIWLQHETCQLYDCGPFVPPLNGNHTGDISTTFNSTIVFSCNSNYLLVGESVMHCDSDGKWSSEVPSCLLLSEIGGACTINEHCKTVGAVCKESRCECITGIYDSRTDKCDTMPLYPYGPNEGDTIHNDWKQCTKAVKFDLGLPLCGKSHSKFFVCAHGVVSFGRGYNTPTPPKNITNVEKLGHDILAPFHAHFSPSKGMVYYRSHNILDSYVLLKDRNETTDIVSKIHQFGNAPSSFEASFILIATWENVRPEDVDFDITNSEGSTFQLVLASNGELTYSFYIYAHGLMNWTSKRSKYVPVWVGHSCNMDTSSTFHTSFTDSALKLDRNAVHRGVSGIVFKPLVPVEKNTKNNNVSCVTWYQENKHEKHQIDLRNNWLPQCPCDIALARWDPWFWHIESWNLYNGRKNICVDMFPSRVYRPYGKSCCYDYETFVWIDERPISGGLYRYHPENTVDHYKQDILPKQVCCSPLTPYCKYFYELRPTGTCYRESPYNFGSFWGDPHFRTLDGMSYTFNGLGEYTLLQIETENITFNLQARTQRAVKLDGNLSDATIFTAFAARDENNASFHVEINRAGNGFNIYGNGKDITKQFNDTSYEGLAILEVPNRTLLISKREQTLVVLFPSSGISLNVSISVEMLSMNAIIPKALSNLTTGLLGNYNGLKDDDFILPNGTILPSNITEREIFNYGKTWEIEETMSAFVYPAGKNHFDYHNASYIPKFLDEASPDKIEEARKVCNESRDNECVFDFVFTDREEIATSTNQLKENRDQTISQMAKVVPEITGCEPINATYEKIVSCPINIDDGTYVEFLTNNVNASYNRDSSTILYYQNKNEPVDVRVVTINEQGRSSPVFVMEILLCTGCSGNGVCTNTPRLDHRNTETFKYATCECKPDYEGPDCETLFNGCSEQPCSLNRDCQILVGHKRTEFNRTYICDICPDGYFGNDTYNDTCTDIDECNNENPPCDHKCTNIDGSYECACTFGYRPDPRNKDKCIDINECEDLNTLHNCSQNCTNTEGSFVCSCFKGYTLDTESEKCFKNNVTDDPCFSKNCSRTNGGCRITDNDTAVCFCESGYELVSNNECIDIDECDGNVCSQLCNNSIGGFECSCFTGYTLIGMTTCQECEVGFWGKECMNECMCKGEGVKTCDPVKGCLCNDGWKGETCQEDINECNETLNACNDPKKDCVNSLGSFSCSCFEGFRENTDGVCEDFDECSIPSLHGCDQICRNSIGSYFCECESGFAMKNSKCENINECEIKTHGCEQVCDDNPGSYNCYCHFGYILNDDRRTCTKSSDPCLTFHNLNCSHYCYVIQERSSAECKCKDGFALGSDNQTCTDINECTEKTHDCVQADCKNTNGSYTCDCSIGFKLQNDERTCTECDDFHYGVNCAMECSCLHGVCNKTHGCECYKGWQDNNCDVDINECTTGQVVCDLVNEQCINTLGSAECHCLQGYTRNESNHCVDIDECSDSRLNSCDQTCINNLGNYTCECQTGFIFMDRTCKDIDECDNKKSKCEQLCENTIGSYNCLCEDGFRLNLTDRESCIPSTECLNPEQCGGNSTCFRNNDEDICKCIKGFQNMSSSCKDINECNSTRRLCHQSCSNTVGSYVCSCHAGYYLLNDYTTCAVCEAGTYGDECKKTCFCNDEHTESCDHVTGACICKPGWEGTICDVDKDECTNTSICPQHSTCNNTYGNYNCICNIGYYSEMCSVCDNKHYGKNCSAECACDYNKTKSCNHINGSCECMEGWNGDTCSDDVDDCKDIDICTEKSNSNCENTDGAYRCVCKDGFRELANICEDIDECIDGTNICEYDCVNTEGSYSCQCKAGYHGDGYNCTIDKCTRLVDSGECDVNDCVIENETAVCKRKSGGLSLPQIIGICAGGIIVLFITVSVIVCVRSRTNRKPLNRRSPPETTFRTDDPSYMKEPNERQPVMTNLGYLTWKTMLTRLKSNESEGTQNEVRYEIPRVHIRRPRKKLN